MKKTAIVSCYFQPNYGSMLQAYATQKALDLLGVENETICIDGLKQKINKRKYRYYLKQITKREVRNEKLKFVKKSLICKANSKLKNGMIERNACFKKFAESNFKLSERYNAFDELSNACVSNYSSVLVGSDQLWLPSNIYADYYTLNFVPDGVRKISYATSFGTSELPKWQESFAAEFLKRIECLSVREKSGQALVKELTGRHPEIVCDPTLLFDAEEWLDIQSKNKLIDDPYIFCYFLGENPKHRQFVMNLKNLTGVKIVTLPHIDSYVKADEKFGDMQLYNVGPGEFVNLIRNAEFVCTDSFHASVFSILNKKKFFTFMRFSNKTKMSTNSRITSLLGIFGLEDRLIKGTEDPKDYMNKEIDYTEVYKKLYEFREHSIIFLKKALDL